MDSATPHSLLLDPRVTHLLITSLRGDGWMVDMTVDGMRCDHAGFETSADAYRWAQVAVACASLTVIDDV